MNEPHKNLAKKLSIFTGAPYVVLTDCCTHALESCLRLEQPDNIKITCYTYISVIMVLEKLAIPYTFTDTKWIGEYNLEGSRIWDSARLLAPNMYKPNSFQCLSFGNTKPVDNKRGGAILLDDYDAYKKLQKMCYDGRDLKISPWIKQKTFDLGFHYNMPFEHAEQIEILFEQYIKKNNYEPVPHQYPDCSRIKINNYLTKPK